MENVILFIEETEFAVMVGFKKRGDAEKFFILKQCEKSNQRNVKLVQSYAYQLKNYLSMPLVELTEGE